MSGDPTPAWGRRGGTTVWMTILLLVGLVVFAMAMSGRAPVEERDVWYDDVHTGLAQGEAQHKPILVLFTADWCPPCKALKAQALSDSRVQSYMKERFVRVKIDLTDRRGQNNQIAIDLGVPSIPTIQIYHPEGHRLAVHRGAAGADELLAWLHDARAQMSK